MRQPTQVMFSALGLLATTAFFAGCGQASAPSAPPPTVTPTAEGLHTFQVEVWADNWFACYVGEEKIAEDSVPITTERSFNAETFTFQAAYPVQLNFVAKDFKEDDSGLEYIGTRRQQMGDGGFIAQVTDLASGKIVAVSDDSWKVTVTHRGPIESACVSESNPQAGVGPCAFIATEEPAGWKTAEFDEGTWAQATIHSTRAVRPKDGYDRISWDGSARIIWAGDLEKDNTLLIRATIPAP